MENPALNYMRNRIETATPEQLTLMLLEGARRYAILAQQCLEERDFINTNSHLKRSQMIVEELMLSLDLDVGPIAFNLYKIYEYLLHCLVQANVRKDANLLPGIIACLSELRDCWAEAVARVNGGKNP